MSEQASTSAGENPMHLSLSNFVDELHLSGEKFMASSSFTKSQYSQVVFQGLSDVYPSDSDIKCTYYLTDVKPQAGDKIAVFKVGWICVSDYITFERAHVPLNLSQNSPLEVTFKAETLPKKYDQFYQLCYVTSGNVIAGASTPFSFRKTHESELVAVEDPSDPELIIFRSRVAQLQDEIEKKTEERDSLFIKYQILDDKFVILKKEFDKCEIDLKNSKEQVDQLLRNQDDFLNKMSELEASLYKKDVEIDSVNAAHEILKNEHKLLAEEKKNDSLHLKEVLEQKYKELLNCESQMQTINDLRKQNSEILQEKDELSEILEGCRIDLQKEKELIEVLTQDKFRLERSVTEHSLANDNLMLEIGNLKFKLQELSEKHNKATAEIHSLKKALAEENEVIKKLTNEIAQQRSVLSSSDKAVYLECKEDMEMYQAQYENLKEHHAKCDRHIQEKIDVLNKQFEDERAKLIVENNELIAKINYLENLQASSSYSSGTREKKNPVNHKEPEGELFDVFTDARSYFQTLFENEPRNKTKEKGNVENLIKEKLRKIQLTKIELRDDLVQQKHKSNELERILIETKEENAALKSRINVLEYELATLKSLKNSTSSSNQPNLSSNQFITEQLDSLNKCLPVIQTFNDNIAEQKLFEKRIQEEMTAKGLLQNKVEFLLQEDAKMSNKLQEMIEKYEQLAKEKEELTKSVTGENVTILQKVLDENDSVISGLKQRLIDTSNQKDKLENLISDLRKELIGKISVDTLSECKIKIASLEKELQKKVDDCKYMAKFIQDRFRDDSQRSNNLYCPLCPSEYRAATRDEFVRHFESHLF